MSRTYFGTDGVRGRVGVFPIVPEFAMRLGYAAGRTLVAAAVKDGAKPGVLIGKDTRVSGYMLEAALEAGFAAAGVDVWLAGPMPTPAVAYLTRTLRLSAGVVISASHNPFDDNGIKFFSAEGKKLPDQVESEIEAAIDLPMGCEESSRLGKARRVDDANGRYIEFCKSTFPNEISLRGMKIVVDAAHGAGYAIAQHVFHELGADIVSIGDKPNGFNINEGVGATHPDALSKAVVENHADLGVALDGDGDRVVMVDSSGRVYDGDALLYVMVKERLSYGKVAGVVGTLMTNVGLEQAFSRLGVEFARAKVGDRYVMEMLDQRGWILGGESSGHLLCLDRHTTGDGMVSALQVLIALCRTGKSLSELVSEVEMFPQTLINVRVPQGFDWRGSSTLKAACAEVESELAGEGRILIRPSGTEPVLRLMVEAKEAAKARQYAERLAFAIPG